MGDAAGYAGQSPTPGLCSRGSSASLWRSCLPPGTRVAGIAGFCVRPPSDLARDAGRADSDRSRCGASSARDRERHQQRHQVVAARRPHRRLGRAVDTASGLGLGLSIAAEIVRLHGGAISAVNADPGLIVSLRLPLAPAASLRHRGVAVHDLPAHDRQERLDILDLVDGAMKKVF
jgi:hypothetical protein